MTPEDVRQRVEDIKAHRHDDEDAHMLEDKLRGDVLRSIAELAELQGCPYTATLAREALKTQDIKFSRWYA